MIRIRIYLFFIFITYIISGCSSESKSHIILQKDVPFNITDVEITPTPTSSTNTNTAFEFHYPNMTFYSSFNERGYTFYAYYPYNGNVENAWKILITKNGEIVKETTVPMVYEPRYGPDASDIKTLEEESDKILKALLSENL